MRATRFTIEQLLQNPRNYNCALRAVKYFIQDNKDFFYKGNQQVQLSSNLISDTVSILDFNNYYFYLKVVNVYEDVDIYSIRLGYTSQLVDAQIGGENPEENFKELKKEWVSWIKKKRACYVD